MRILFSLALLAAAAHGQTFEAASIKPNVSGSGSSSANGSRGQIVFTNASLRSLIERAFRVNSFQVVGPGWLDTLHFDISAKYPPDSKDEDHPLMLRKLLEERFGLAVHKESKEFPGYALMPAKTGFKLRPVQKEGGSIRTSSNNKGLMLTAVGISMADLAGALAGRLRMPVFDRTGIPGVFDIEMKWNLDDAAAASDPDAPPSLFTALQEEVGLRLQSQKVPLDVIVVDRIERTPTEN